MCEREKDREGRKQQGKRERETGNRSISATQVALRWDSWWAKKLSYRLWLEDMGRTAALRAPST